MGIKKFIKKFFDNLEIYEDQYHGTKYKKEIYISITQFLDNKTEINAYNVYKAFFEAYWIGIQDEVNPFLELTQRMKNFEEFNGKLLENHRDHYIHTVFVFLLGLSIFAENTNYRKIFSEYALDKSKYPDFYDTPNEEFFYRWGLSALFHDIAYPLEIIIKQTNEYIKFVSEYSDTIGETGINIKLSTNNSFFNLPILKPRSESKDRFNAKYNKFQSRFLDNSISLLAYTLYENFNLNLHEIKNNLDNFVENMNENNRIDHGFFSAIIMLKWYHYLIKRTNWNPAYFYFPILDSSSSILLHNYYKHTLMEDPFNLSQIRARQHPIAYLLILCDELQEWNREGYGKMDIKDDAPTDFDLFIDELELKIKYKYLQKTNNNDFLKEKHEKISSIVKINDIFKNGIKIE
ncbi:hypothetical protein [Methanobacterium formicicum]|uniref:Uncharacterized protein n=1 Tax=Methanobacterium formicicum (strain DSM 3637 / PP1) TaxID=1204725 RepID=K2RT17_METFP|nr:hypothetical protein [Methanobacterium formicicum]EKF85860.1 hypothetical protein A994_07260 [Methanobacterium formicicum DSM 3637]